MCGPAVGARGVVDANRVTKTSNPAPARRRSFRATISAASSTRLPRAVLMRIAPGFIVAMASTFNQLRVSGVSGMCSDTMSAVCSSSCFDTFGKGASSLGLRLV
ncbi:MAG: hypothetical protein QF832_03740 [SAR324 cluster bacterium]|nr:hypothetical protein [SAR324 cluster bacterium]